MQQTLNAREVLEIAQQIERNGARFYRRASEVAGVTSAGRTLKELAVMEEKHERIFESMESQLTPEERQEPLYDPYGEEAHYLRAAAGGRVFDLTVDPVEWLEEGRTMDAALRKGMQMEKDSIVYYMGLKGGVPEHLGQEWVDRVIREEMSHLRILYSMLGLPG